MDWHVWLAYFLAAWLIALSPGSGAVLSMSHGLQYGVRQTTATIVGLQIGLASILLVAGAGVGALLLASTTAFMVVKVLGAGYLIWLGVKQWRAPLGGAQSDLAAPTEPIGLSLRQRVLRGALTNATNPKGIVFMVAGATQPADGSGDGFRHKADLGRFDRTAQLLVDQRRHSDGQGLDECP